MTAPKVGDRVRVVFEGVVQGAPTGEGFWVGSPAHRTFIWRTAEQIVSVEILPPPVKVGDVIETAEELDALPVGAVVRPLTAGCVCAEQTDHGRWYFANGLAEPVLSNYVRLPARVIDLPDGAA